MLRQKLRLWRQEASFLIKPLSSLWQGSLHRIPQDNGQWGLTPVTKHLYAHTRGQKQETERHTLSRQDFRPSSSYHSRDPVAGRMGVVRSNSLSVLKSSCALIKPSPAKGYQISINHRSAAEAYRRLHTPESLLHILHRTHGLRCFLSVLFTKTEAVIYQQPFVLWCEENSIYLYLFIL